MKDLIAAHKGSVPTADEGAVGAAPSPPPEEPYGVATQLHPSGVEVFYQEGPKRLYRVRATYDGGKQDPDYPWQEVPSVSTVTDILGKGGLSWWGMKVGIEGLQTQAREARNKFLLGADTVSDWLTESTVEELIDGLKKDKLTVNHVKDKAGKRGTSVHKGLETYCETGVLPDPKLFPENERGYVEGLVAFLKDSNLEPIHSELMVGSIAHGYAGRFDVFGTISGYLVTKTYPKRADKRDPVGGYALLDLKTSKGVYESYHLQLAGYEWALDECGYDTPDFTAVVRVTEDGRYELVKGRATPEDFLSLLDTYHVVQRLKGKA